MTIHTCHGARSPGLPQRRGIPRPARWLRTLIAIMGILWTLDPALAVTNFVAGEAMESGFSCHHEFSGAQQGCTMTGTDASRDAGQMCNCAPAFCQGFICGR